jgi:hypothetical protein
MRCGEQTDHLTARDRQAVLDDVHNRYVAIEAAARSDRVAIHTTRRPTSRSA